MTKAEKRAIRSDAWRQAISQASGRAEQERIYRSIVDPIIPTKAARREDRADRPARVEAPATPGPSRTIFTDAPDCWHGVKLYDWGAKGLRGEGNVKRGDSRPRKTFDLNWIKDYATFTPDARLTRAVKSLTAEVWPVYRRRGRYWKLDHYMTSAKVLEQAKATLPEPEATPVEPEPRSDVDLFAEYAQHIGLTCLRATENKVQLGLSGVVGRPSLASLDYVVYNDGGQNMLVQVIDLDNPATSDAGALQAWVDLFGDDFAGVQVWRADGEAPWVARTLDGHRDDFAAVAASLDGIPV